MTDDTGNLMPAEAAELEGLEEAMANPREWHQPGNQVTRDRALALYEKQTGGEPARATGPSSVEARKVEIETAMQSQDGEYWHSEKLQNEYLNLLESEGAGGPEELQAARLRSTLGESAHEVAAAYEGLSDSLKAALEIEYPDSEAPRSPASTQDIATFSATGHGQVLMPQWGADASRLLGVAIARMARIEAGMSEADLTGWRNFFFNKLPVNARAAVVDYIVR